jgi:single-strand DNA-binding protein
MNRVCLIGRLTGDPEMYNAKSGTVIARYRLAVDRYNSQTQENEADFIPVVAFGSSAVFAQKYLHKGIKIAVEGSIKTGSYDKQDGSGKVYTLDVIADRHEFCESKQQTAAPSQQGYTNPSYANVDLSDFEETDPEDLPF